ncbi:glutathione hydrolase 5 proenzyme isoform X2 [Hyperolius riggenbachi]|uniref:glutathione hydrolase 5 proenzyme isoform X2 n=1 Tax=Hyperolius riggenbachi TaxID=752182 RepID=UPI0035A3A841
MTTRGVLCLILLALSVVVGVITLLALWREKPCDHGFLHGAVAADSEVCSNIGRDVLKQGGSPVDSAIAALICTSVIHPQSMGLGGGVIFTIYNASTGEVEIINARETVPSGSPPNLTDDCFSPGIVKPGVQWIGVPGELRGYEAAHQRHGRLPWKSLFEPTIKLVTNGIQVSSLMHKYLAFLEKSVKSHSLCQLFCKDQEVLKEGEYINFTQLGDTLRVLAEEGAESFYTGSIAKKMIDDLKKERYRFSASSVQNETAEIQTYHYIAEAFKFANGQKGKLADYLAVGSTKQLTEYLMSQSLAEKIREKIDGSGDHPLSFYNVSAVHPETMGTSHISVISQDGSSVSVTSSVNHLFGSMIYSPSTGIILNNELADFCLDSSSQPVTAGQQPPSSMTPAILLSHDRKSQLAIGGAGGVRIISATAQAIINTLWFGYNLEEAISRPVFHVTSNNKLEFEPSFSKVVEQALREKGHQINNYTFALNVVQGVSQKNGCLFAFSDGRKHAKAAGY